MLDCGEEQAYISSMNQNEQAAKLLEGVDLAQRGTTVIDLCRRATAQSWTPWGSSYGSWVEKNEGEMRDSPAEATRVSKRCRTRALAQAVLVALDATPHWSTETGKLSDMQFRIYMILMGRWYPNRFINPKGTAENNHHVD